jgi:predicted nucleic-acid-binding protein
VIGIDTNILVRFLVDDDPAQNAVARLFLSARTAEEPAYISAIVIAETVWILHNRLNYPMSVVAELVQNLLAADGLVIECTEELDALLSTGQPLADLADYLIAWAAKRAGARTTLTFDKRAAARVSGMELLA